MNQSIRVILFGSVLLASFMSTLLLWAESPKSDAEARESTKALRRLREGDEIEDNTGYFRTNADRLLFRLSGGGASQEYGVLENLALERVTRVLDEKPGKREWSVSGTITEYRGNYYILISRAILKSKRLGK